MKLALGSNGRGFRTVELAGVQDHCRGVRGVGKARLANPGFTTINTEKFVYGT